MKTFFYVGARLGEQAEARLRQAGSDPLKCVARVRRAKGRIQQGVVFMSELKLRPPKRRCTPSRWHSRLARAVREELWVIENESCITGSA